MTEYSWTSNWTSPRLNHFDHSPSVSRNMIELCGVETCVSFGSRSTCCPSFAKPNSIKPSTMCDASFHFPSPQMQATIYIYIHTTSTNNVFINILWAHFTRDNRCVFERARARARIRTNERTHICVTAFSIHTRVPSDRHSSNGPAECVRELPSTERKKMGLNSTQLIIIMHKKS